MKPNHFTPPSPASLLATLSLFFLVAVLARGEKAAVGWRKIQLDNEFYGEGASFGDIDGDGAIDIVSGPWVYFGPDWSTEHRAAIYRPKPFKKAGYSDNFFSFTRDLDGDGDLDVLVLGFPGKDASWFENPGKGRDWEGQWARHQVLDIVDNESPDFIDLTGDGAPEIVCSQGGVLGYAEINADDPQKPWTFTAISPPKSTGARFTHGLGVGDVNGDGRLDLLEKQAWWEQPASRKDDTLWQRHAFAFSGPGGADMFAYDFDGDGDNDVITSLAAHGYGLAWYERVERGGKPGFEKHLIMGRTPQENSRGVAFSQLHALALADIDGDGVKDIVTGKRHWAHNGHDPEGNGAAVLYWFRTVRGAEGGVEFVPFRIDDDSGVGTDVRVGDLDGDGLPDVIVGNKKGTFIHLQRRGDQAAAAAAPTLKRPVRKPFVETGLTPEVAVGRMSLTEGFRVRVIAAEPDVRQPIAMAIDERGRLWIAEAHSYPVRQPEGEGKDRILIFADEDGDGEFETRKVFAEGLNLVSGIEVGYGGVWVGAAPHLLFIADKDRDDVPDGEPKILLDGWGYQDTHETLNSFVWGPDGWLYGCHGVFTHSKVGKPGTPEAGRAPLNAGVWRYHPVRHEFEVFAHGTSNPWGLDFDERGEAFVTACVIPHLFHMVQGGRYRRQGGRHFNPHTYDDIKTIADHVHYAGDIRDNAHWGGKTPIAPADTLTLGGGHAHCGLTIYRGNQFPGEFRGQLLFANLHGHGIVSDFPVPEGSGFIGKHGADFLHTNDRWSMPIDLQYGPDGGVFMIDWYDRQNCHRRDAEIWDRSNGRIYKVEYGEGRTAKPTNLASLSDAELVKLQRQPNAWWGHTARRLLRERAATSSISGAAATDEAVELMASADLALRLNGLWTLDALGALTEERLIGFTKDGDAAIRGWALRLLSNREGDLSVNVVARCVEMAKSDPSPVVRRHLASLLQRLSHDQCWDVAENLLARAEDAKDHNIPLLIWYGVEPLVMEDAARALRLAAGAKIPRVRQFIYRRLAHDNDGREALLTRVSALKGKAKPQTEILNEIAAVLADRASAPMPKAWDAAFAAMDGSGPEARRTLERLATKFGDRRMLPRFRRVLADPKANPAARENALGALLAARDAEAVPVFQQLAAGPKSPLRAKAIRALANFTDEATPEVLLGALESLDAAEKSDAISVLASSPAHARALLDALAGGRVPRGAISAFAARQIRSLDDDTLSAALEKHWGKVTESTAAKKAELARYRELLTPKFLARADLSRGRALFNQTCFACHTLFGEGNAIGPDITGGNRRDLEFLLENILDPSAIVGDDYRLVVFTMKDGRVVSGMVRGENDNAVRVALVGADEQLLPREGIEKREPLAVSMMPEGMLAPLKDAEIRDLIAYLQSPVQARLATPGEIFLQGEDLRVVKKSAGDPRPQAMGGFKAGRWSGDRQLWWTGAKPGDTLVLEFDVPEEGNYAISAVLTKARDYGIVRVTLDGETMLAEKIDLFNPDEVVTTGELGWGDHDLGSGAHTLEFKITGSNPAAVHRHMFAIDSLRLVKR